MMAFWYCLACGKARRHLLWRHVAECRFFARSGTASTAAAPGDQNPLVAVIDFTVEHRNIDEMSEAE